MSSCASPIPMFWSATVNDSGRRSLISNPLKAHSPFPVYVRCNQCVRCRLNRASDWAVRCMHEASLYDDNCFVTLTYDDARLPEGFDGRSLNRRHLQLFLKRLRDFSVRTRGRGFRFYGCGEYGERFGRPHYHLCLFDFEFKDKVFFRSTDVGNRVFQSERLDQLWPYGRCEIGSVTYESAGYVARYCLKKITGDAAKEHYHYLDAEGRSCYRVPEFPAMSLKPGIGVPWLEKFSSDVYNGDFVVVGRAKLKPPRRYDLSFELVDPDRMDAINRDRRRRNHVSRSERIAESTFDRFATKQEVSLAKLGVSTTRKVE